MIKIHTVLGNDKPVMKKLKKEDGVKQGGDPGAVLQNLNSIPWAL